MAAAADPRVREALAAFRAGVEGLVAVGLSPGDVVEAGDLVRAVEAGARTVGSVQADLLGVIDRSGVYAADGHRSAKVLVRHAARLSDAEALRRAKAARAMVDLPAVAAAFREGRIGWCQITRVARVHANGRVRELLVEVEGHVAVLAERLSYRDFDRHLTDWERLADEDGAGDAAERAEAGRDFRIGTNLDGSVFLEGSFGSATGAELRDIHDHFTEAELAADWAEARGRLGDAAGFEDLRRSHKQRRADALAKIMRIAAGAAADQPGGSVVVTNIVMDLATFERHLRRVCSDEPAPNPDPRVATMLGDLVADLDTHTDDTDDSGQDVDADDADWHTVTQPEPEPDADPEPEAPVATPRDGTGFRCDTLDGHPIDPAEATATALLGHVRRVVVGTDGVVVNMGRRTRLFTGPRRLAVLLTQTTCYWPGCNAPVTACEADHLEGFSSRTRGPTDPANAGPACGRHNRFKEQGFTARRDDRGHWHIYRPDGTEIT